MQPLQEPSKRTYQTGPRTEAGKETSSQNATTHGGTSQKLILAGERQEDFDALLAALLVEFTPATEGDRDVVEDAALARWSVWRKQRAFNAIESEIYTAQPDPGQWTDAQHHRLALADRYKTTAERAFKRALNNIEGLRKRFIAEQDRLFNVQKWEAADGLSQRRLQMEAQSLDIARERDARVAKKEEPAFALARIKAEEALAYHLQKNEERRKSKEEYERRKAFNGFDVPTLVQDLYVSIKEGVTTTSKKPPNKAFHEQLEKANADPPTPFPEIVRRFKFPKGMPPEYHWITSNEDYRRDPGHEFFLEMSIEEWREIFNEEQAAETPHALPGPRFVPQT